MGTLKENVIEIKEYLNKYHGSLYITNIDEYFFQPELYKKFRGAVSTMNFPVKLKRLESAVVVSKKNV